MSFSIEFVLPIYEASVGENTVVIVTEPLVEGLYAQVAVYKLRLETLLLMHPDKFFPLALKVILPATLVTAVIVLLWR